MYRQAVTSVVNAGTLKCAMRSRLSSAFGCNRRK